MGGGARAHKLIEEASASLSLERESQGFSADFTLGVKAEHVKRSLTANVAKPHQRRVELISEMRKIRSCSARIPEQHRHPARGGRL